MAYCIRRVHFPSFLQVVKNISDDEGDDVPADWVKQLLDITPATKAIAIKWVRTARVRMAKAAGKGAKHCSGKTFLACTVFILVSKRHRNCGLRV